MSRSGRQLWPNAAVQGHALSDLARPKDFERVTAALSEETVTAGIVCGPDVDLHVEAIGRFAAAGFTEVYLHQIGPDQAGFLRFCRDCVLPQFA